MATHSSILAWRIPWTGEPGGLPSMGSHRSSGVIRIDILKKDKKGFKENMYVHDAVKKTLFNGTEGKESRERYPEEKIFHLNHEHLHSL